MPTLLRDVAVELKARLGCAIHAYATNKEQTRFLASQNAEGIYDTVTEAAYPLRALDDVLPPRDEIVGTARAYEEKLGCTYNRLALGNRHFGRGFALLGPGHPRSRYSERSSYLHVLHGFNRLFGFWEAELAAKRIDLVLGNSPELALIAHTHQVPYRALFAARHKNLHYWGDDEYRGSSAVEPHYRALVERGDDGITMTEAYALAQANHARMTAAVTLPRTLARMGLHSLKVLRWRTLGYEKGRGYYLRDDLALMLRSWRDWRRLNGAGIKRLAELGDTPFVFFPLQTEPETAIHHGSPEYFYQHAAIAALARDLPAGYLLAVKETPFGVGRRPRGFYRHVAALKNVVWLAVDERGFDVVRKAAAVAVVVGTAGFEGAAMGKPVISFGRHNIYGFLPHVFVVADEVRLKSTLAHALSPQFDHEASAVAGRRFIRAVAEASFDLGAYDYHAKGGHTAENVRACVDGLLATF